MKAKEISAFFLALTVFSCSSDDEAPPDDQPMADQEEVSFVVAPATNINARDIANTGTIKDLEISFDKPEDISGLDQFRIFLVNADESGNFDLDVALSIEEANYRFVQAFASSSQLNFENIDLTDVNGRAIEDSTGYRVFVLSVPKDDTGQDPVLSGSSPFELKHVSAVRTIGSSIRAGSGGMDVDEAGNIYMADFGQSLSGPPGRNVYKIGPDLRAEIFASGLVGASGNDFDDQGNLFQSNIGGNRISKITPDGAVSTYAVGLVNPVGIVFDGEENFYVCNCGNNTISKVEPDGTVSLFSSGSMFNCPNGIDRDENGNFYVANFSNGSVIKIDSEGTPEIFTTIPGANNGHLLIQGEYIYVVARGAHSIYRVTFDGTATVFAGSGIRGADNGGLLEATFSLPNDIAFSPDGSKMYVNDVGNLTGPTGDISPVIIREIDIVD